MRPLSPGEGLSPLGLLNRRPDYLRKQLEGSTGGRTPSAVERLEADKAKYVKSQQVINSRQEPVLLCYTFQSPACGRRALTLHQQGEFSQVGQDGLGPKKLPPSPQSPIARRGGGRRMLRPDSLVIYRQKRDCSAVNKENTKGYSLVRRLFQGPLRDGHGASPSSRGMLGDGQLQVTQEETSMVWVPAEKEETRTISSVGILMRTSVGRASERSLGHQPSSQLVMDQTSSSTSPEPSDSKRELAPSYSLPLSEKERFFNYCGLDQNLVEKLGAERFKPGSWELGSSCVVLGSVGSASSEHDCLSLNEEELSVEELSEKPLTSVSVIERNARVIKWLYSCQQALSVAKESTV
ncbi:protein FAM110D [Podarcis raffonei]|uniref:protein FAM110D n=1 Tax=Podarcis raffonei TaxID=65483 RepID=UPI0023293436|nr:protein FAM110D [Podarcis raffonei]XP_053254684.1 protein FAM110D [Podarcis raffonei]XP_053254685.1 protein FAM110D [Podarcis raffonei]XP_053254686.1 protein FAM110D [Podarcis raffonei]XP_053254687.1 protein FAM110D [Podarcis raffonei]XP_053254688.1 protein FAM110D [Podarcis raffonei]